MSTVIIGAGIIGCSTAYYLSELHPQNSHSIHLIESSPELFASASGKSGGFLAADWYAPPVAPLGELSFRLHNELANKNGGREKWGYTFTSGTSYTDSPQPKDGPRGDDWLRQGTSRAEAAGSHSFQDGKGPAWLTRKHGDNLDTISEDETCAQVDPLQLSQYLLEQCRSRGVQLHHPAHAVSINKDDRGQLQSVRIRDSDGSESDIECTRLLVTAGAWTPRVFKTLFPASSLRIPISQLAGHSIVLKSPRWEAAQTDKGCHAVFTTTDAGFSPEMFSRMNGEIYFAGLNSSSIPLPDRPTDAKIDSKSIDMLKEACQKMLGLPDGKKDLEVVREGLCFRPVTPRGQPILSRVSDDKIGIKTLGAGKGGVFVAAGHGPWGISLSLGTGKVMAETMMGETTSADVRRLVL